MMDDQLARVQQVVSSKMNGILDCFKAGAKITVIVRTPGNDEADFLMTNEEDLEKARTLIARRIEAVP